MTVTIVLTKNIVVTDAGTTIIDRQFDRTVTPDDVVEGTLRIPDGQSKYICAEGAEGAEVSPMVLSLTKIRGYLFNLDVQIDLELDGVSPGTQHGPGVAESDQTDLVSIKLVNESGLDANIKYIVWGNR